jgi:hypothetical protein
MAQRFVTNLNLNQNELQNAKFQVVPSDPNSNTFEGWLIYNSTEKTVKYFDGTSWKRAVISLSVAGDAASGLVVSNNSDGTVTLTTNLATSSSAGFLSASDKAKLDNATADATSGTLVLRDINGNFKAATPTDAAHVATKGYVDSARSGLDVKQSVRAATTGPITIATDLEAGDTLDTTVTLVAGDRVLVKDQSTASENGIYIVQPSGAPVRAGDFDSTEEVTPGAFTFVEEGTENGDAGFVVITDGTITVGTTGIEWAQFSGTGQIVAGEALEKDGNTLNVLVDDTSIEVFSDELRIAEGAAGDGLGWTTGVLNVNVAASGAIEIAADNLQVKLDPSYNGLISTNDGLRLNSNVAGTGLSFSSGTLSVDAVDLTSASGGGVAGVLPIANGGTNASTEEQARTNLAYTSPTGANTTTPVLARVASKVIGDGANTSFDVVHNFGTRAVVVQVFDSSSYDTVIADVVRATTDKVTVGFSSAPASNAFTVVVTG